MDALDAIANRHSSRSFKPDPISKEDLEKIVNAGRLAASGKNEQPWEFVVVTDRAMLGKIADLTDYGKFIAGASACVALFCRETMYYLEDGATAAQNVLVAATALGWQSCWVSGDKRHYAPAVGQLLSVPSGIKLIALLAIGHETHSEPRRSKRPLADVLHWEKF